MWPQQWNCNVLPLSYPFQNGLMVKVTETCPELNCTVSEQILPDGRCCNVCRGMSSILLHSSQLYESFFLWTCTHRSPAAARSKHSHAAGCWFRQHPCSNSVSLPFHLAWILLGWDSYQSRLVCLLWSTCYANLPVPRCFGREVLQGK